MPRLESRRWRDGGSFQAAFDAHQAGRLAEAEAAYRQLLERDPCHADVLHLLGLVCHQKGQPGEAQSLIRQALAQREEAAFLLTLGVVLKDSGNLTGAEAAYLRALALQPDLAEACNNLGRLQKQTGRLTEAETSYGRALELRPDFAAACYNLGLLLQESGRVADAEAAYRRTLALKPDQAEAHNDLANLLQETGRPNEAEAAYRRALELQPDYAQAHYNLGLLLQQAGRGAEAESAYRRAVALQPEHAKAHNNLGLLLVESKRLAEAEAAYRRAPQLQPDFASAYNNLGILLKETRRVDEAEAAYRRALQLKPDDAEARWNLGLLRLSLGRYAEGWPDYECRYHHDIKISALPDLPFPQWRGESLAGKSLLLWPEQGFGDYIQFARYAPMLKARGVSCLTLACAPPLKALLETVAGVDRVIDSAALPVHDFWVFPLSLPLNLGTTLATIPADLPYLHALPQRLARWRDRLPRQGLKVGLVWRGSAVLKNDANRSLPGLAALAPLWAVPGVSFVSLQKGRGEDEARQAPPDQPLIALGSEIEDFADSAAIVAQLDLVICVDTALAHLAGALGRPCWLLLPSWGTDWRWLRGRSDSPWYPEVMRLFRQTMLDNWSETIAEVAAALAQWAATRRER